MVSSPFCWSIRFADCVFLSSCRGASIRPFSRSSRFSVLSFPSFSGRFRSFLSSPFASKVSSFSCSSRKDMREEESKGECEKKSISSGACLLVSGRDASLDTGVSLFTEKTGVAGSVYAQYRPEYPPALFSRISDLLSSSFPDLVESREFVSADIACGTGQAVSGLIPFSKKIYALDGSESQIASFSVESTSHCEVIPFVADAYHTKIPSNSCHIVTCAQAAHWLDMDLFYPELDRILLPGGTFAYFGYELTTFRDNDNANAVLFKLYSETLGKYWSNRRNLVTRKYLDIPPPYPLQTLREDFSMEDDWSIDEYISYLNTWSALATFVKEEGYSPLPQVREDLLSSFETADGNHRVPVLFQYFAVFSTKSV